VRSGLTNPQREKQIRTTGYAIEGSHRLRVATDPGKVYPIDLRRRHQPAQHGVLVKTGPWGSRSAAGHTNGRRAATRARPPPPARTVGRALSVSPRGRVLVPRAAYSEPLGRSTIRTCGSGCRLRGRGQSIPEPRGCARPNILPHRAAAETTTACMLPPIGALTRANSGSEKSVSV
jgi:hypothetical protein